MMILSQNPCLEQVLGCPVCGAVRGHEPGCLLKLRDDLNLQRSQISCPECGGLATIDVNLDDYLECSNCHSQFSRSGLVDSPNPRRIILVDNKSGEYFPVLILARKGKGKIRINMQLASIQRKINAIIKFKNLGSGRGRRSKIKPAEM